MGRFFTDALKRQIDEKTEAALAEASTEEADDPVTHMLAFTSFTIAATAERVLELHDEHAATLQALTERLAALEAQPFTYDGPHEAGKAYSKGTFVTRDGSLWHCNRSTTAQPGDGVSWTLAVKKPRDGRDRI